MHEGGTDLRGVMELRGAVDLRSDTVTQPTAAMRAAMAAAEVGDDVYGEDPTVTALEQRVAALLGHEAGVFTPTGSLANQLGLRLLVQPGQELVCDDDAHVVRAELGAAAALSGITTRTWRAPRASASSGRRHARHRRPRRLPSRRACRAWAS